MQVFEGEMVAHVNLRNAVSQHVPSVLLVQATAATAPLFRITAVQFVSSCSAGCFAWRVRVIEEPEAQRAALEAEIQKARSGVERFDRLSVSPHFSAFGGPKCRGPGQRTPLRPPLSLAEPRFVQAQRDAAAAKQLVEETGRGRLLETRKSSVVQFWFLWLRLD